MAPKNNIMAGQPNTAPAAKVTPTLPKTVAERSIESNNTDHPFAALSPEYD